MMKIQTTETTRGQALKKLLRIHQSSEMHRVGNGFPVRSVFDYNGLGRELSRFLRLEVVQRHFPAFIHFVEGHGGLGAGGPAVGQEDEGVVRLSHAAIALRGWQDGIPEFALPLAPYFALCIE
jgi:hypothetical protein